MKKLLKEYHPDNNKKDKKTIYILYEVKKELENNTLEYNLNPNIEKTDSNNNYDNDDINFFQEMIDILKKKQKQINEKIHNLYLKLNKKYDKKNKTEQLISELEIENLEYRDAIDNLLKFTKIDITVFISIILLFIFTLVFKKWLFLLFIILLVIIEIYYINIRSNDYEDSYKKLNKIKERKNQIEEKCNNLKEEISKLEKEEVKIKSELRKVNNDLHYYGYQLSKVNSKENVNSNNKSYTKRK